ncbi:hypothetical protein ACEQ8H_002958 [Pleosporales sp. CAS-2024a]
MASHKRGEAFHRYGDRNQPFGKKQRTVYNSAALDSGSNQHGKPPQRGSPFAQQHSHAHSAFPELSAAEMQTGLVALLDRFVAAETTPNADMDILHHARELRRLVAARDQKSASAQAKRELDEKRPNQAANVTVPDYMERNVVALKDLPPAPPVSEPHLREAVFTHRSVHLNATNVHEHVDLGLDYERLEYLGDAYIELIATRSLYNRFPHVDVPQLCSWRERLVENIALAKFSESYGFPDQLKVKIEFDKDTKGWRKVVADIFEAYVAGVVLSDPTNGFATAEKWLDELWAPQLLGFKEKVVENVRARDDLQKMLVVNGIQLKYKEERPMVMEKGLQKYFMGVYLTGWGYDDKWLGSGEGQKKAQASIAAATDALKRDSHVLRDAVRQKKELMEIRAKEREQADADAAENGQDEPATKATHDPDDTLEPTKKRKSDKPHQSPEQEKKSKRHKKEKTDETDRKDEKDKRDKKDEKDKRDKKDKKDKKKDKEQGKSP